MATYGVQRLRPSRPSTWLDVLLLCAPLATAAVNTSTGTLVGLIVLAVLGVRWWILLACEPRPIDYLTLLLIAVILVPHTASSSSIGVATAVAMTIPVRWVVQTRRDFARVARVISWMCTAYAVYFLGNRIAIDTAGVTRETVDFANANYTGAVLAFGAVVSFWIFRSKDSRAWPLLYLAAAVLQFYVVLRTGSRASAAGAALGLAVIWFGARTPRLAYRGTFVLLVAGFFVGFSARSADLFRWLSEPLSGASATFARSNEALFTVSGREQIWAGTRRAASEEWLFGWGPDTYRFAHPPPYILAHAWGLEYVASIGVIGALVAGAVIVLSYGGGSRHAGLSVAGRTWVAATGLALLPNLVLSTHQWTMWAWFGFALWSRAGLVGVGEHEPGEVAAERPTKSHAVR